MAELVKEDLAYNSAYYFAQGINDILPVLEQIHPHKFAEAYLKHAMDTDHPVMPATFLQDTGNEYRIG